MFPADRDGDPRRMGPGAVGADPHQLAHPVAVEDVERVLGIDPLPHIGAHEAPRIVARQPVGHLRQVVRPEAQEGRVLGDLARAQRRARGFDHHPQPVGEIVAGLVAHGGGDGVDAGLDQLDLAAGADQRDHDLGDHGIARAAGRDGGLEDRAGLHVVDLGHGDAQPHAAHPQHGVELGQGLDPAGHVGQRQVQRFGQLAHPLAVMGQELVQGGVEQADRDGQPGHDAKQRDEVAALHRQQPVQRQAPVLGAVGEDHLAHGRQALVVEEHVLGAAQPDALGVEHPRGARVLGCVGVGAHPDPAQRVGPVEQLVEAVVERGFQHLGRAGQHLARGAVDGDLVALAQDPAARAHLPGAQVDRDRARADDAGQADAAGDHRRVAGHAAAFGQDGDRGVHPADVLGNGFAAHQHAAFAPRLGGLCGRGGKDDPPGRGPRACVDAARDQVAGGARIDLVVQQVRKGARLDPHHRLGGGDDAVARQRHRDAHRGAAGARDAHRVDDREPPVRDDELDLHFLAQAFAGGDAIAHEVGKDLGCGLLERGAARVARQVERLGPLALRAALGLAAEAAGDARRARHRIDELDGPAARDPRPDRQRHVLHDEPQRRVGGCPLGLAQQPRGRPVPGPRHRAQHLGQLAGGVLGELLVGFVLVGAQGRGEAAFAVREAVGIEAGDVDGVGLDEPQVDRVGGRLAARGDKAGVAFIVDAHVQDRPRPAPGRVHRRGPDADEALRAVDDRGEPGAVGHVAGRDRAHRIGRNGKAGRDRQFHAHETLQAFRPPAVARDLDPRRRGDFDDRFGGREGGHRGVTLVLRQRMLQVRRTGAAAPAPPRVFRQRGGGISPRSARNPRSAGPRRGSAREGSGGCGARPGFRC